MKQVVFAVFLIAMASLTGCLDEDEPSDTNSEDLIDPINAYEPPQISSIMVDNGYQGFWEGCNDGNNDTTECEYIPCTKQGYHDADGDGDNEYCDLDGHYNGGPQVIVNKIGNKVTIECIKSDNLEHCKGGSSAYLIFTSIEGLQEMIYCYMAEEQYDQDTGESRYLFHMCEATLGFEPASFEISSSSYYFGNYDSSDYYGNVVFRVF